MADLLGEVDTNIPSRLPLKTVKNASRRKLRVLSPPISCENRVSISKPSDAAQFLNTPPLEANDNNDDGFLGGMDDDALPQSDPVLSSPTTNAVERKGLLPVKLEKEEEEEEDMMEVAQVVGDHKIKTTSVNMSGSRLAPKAAKAPAYPSPASSSPTRPPAEAVDASAWNEVTSKLNVLSSQGPESSSFGKLTIEDVVEGDGRLRFFWTDYTEIHGSLCLFGKVKEKNSGAFASAFVKVDNILRKLYFLPRTYRQSKYRDINLIMRAFLHLIGHGRDTSTEVEMGDVYQEVDEVMTKLRVGMHKIKPCSRKYAFELPDIPKEADYLKLMYPYDSR